MSNNYLITGYHGEPHVTAENDRGIHAATFGVGRFVLPVGEQFRAVYIGNNTIRMYDGKLMDNGAAAGIPAGEHIDFTIANAGQGMKRNDLIIFRYAKNPSTQIESGTFEVIRGTETGDVPSDPALPQTNLLVGTAVSDRMALWRVQVSGTSIATPERVFTLYNKNFSETGLNVEKFSVSNIAEFTIKMSEIETTMVAPAVNHCIISKSDWDNALPSGDYFIEICKPLDGYAIVTAKIVCDGNQIVLRRVLNAGVWQAWEWENPLLTQNVEYRTTEKWDGKPVYTQLLPIGNWTSGGTLDYSISPHVIRYTGCIAGWTLPFINSTLDNTYSAWATFQNKDGKLRLGMLGGSGVNGYGGHIQIWYYKL